MGNLIVLLGALVTFTNMLVGCTEGSFECSSGDSKKCECPNGGTGTKRCTDEGTWGVCKKCSSNNGADECTPGKEEPCDCENGNEGVRICDDSGESWGACDECETTGNKYTQGVYDASCIGDSCDFSENCCENTVCGSLVFDSFLDSIENYCYPSCRPEETQSTCNGNDICVDFGNETATCLSTGEISFSSMVLPVGVDYDAAITVEGTDVDHTASLGNENFLFDIFYAYWNEFKDSTNDTVRELIIRADGLIEPYGIWNMLIYIPETLIQQGVGSYPWYVETDDTVNFSIELYSGVLNEDYDYEEMWLESLTDDAILTIEQTCTPCSLQDAECDICEFSIEAYLLGMKTKLKLFD